MQQVLQPGKRKHGEDYAQGSRRSEKIHNQNTEYHSFLVDLCHCIKWGNVYLNYSKATLE